MSASPKLNFLNRQRGDEDDLSFENLVNIAPSEYRPTHLGVKLHRSLARTRIMRGGLGSGKTRTATEHIDKLCLRYPGALVFIGRKDITSLKVTTQREYLEKVVTPETIQGFNVNENTLYYKNGSIVLFRETKEPDKVKSLELTAYMLDECDENPTDEIWEKLDDRLRQKIWSPEENRWIIPPYAGLLVFNPTDEDHWLYHLAQRKDIDLEDFRFETPDNAPNLPPDYVANLLKKLPPWEVSRLVYGHWGRTIRGKPVYHGVREDHHYRYVKVRPDLPLLRGWDFGYGHPAVRWSQFDPVTSRYVIIREFLGSEQKLQDTPQKEGVVSVVKRITGSLVAPTYPIYDYGDPHGADEKDNAISSIEYLRVHHQIFVRHKRERIKTGMDEIQEKIVTDKPLTEEETAWFPNSKNGDSYPLFVISRDCPITWSAYLGGYHRDEHGIPKKDGYYDHLPDTDRYVVTHNMNSSLAQRYKNLRRYRPRNIWTGY